MAVSEAVNPYENPGGWFGQSRRHAAAARKGWRSKKRKRRKRRRRNPPAMSANPRRKRRRRRRRNPAVARGIPLLQDVKVQDIAVGGVSFIVCQKAAEIAAQTGWADVAVKTIAAVACGLVAEQGLPGTQKYAVMGGIIPAALGALYLLSNGQWGMVTTGSAHVATGRRYALPARVAVPQALPSPMGI